MNGNTAQSIQVAITLPFSQEQVWEAWTNADQVAQWWGPDGFTNTIHKMEFVTNGEWRLTMHGPDGKAYPNKSIFTEIVPKEKIVFQHFNPHYLATIIFATTGKETQLEWTMVFDTAELFETVVNVFKADEGLSQNVKKLQLYLAKQSSVTQKTYLA